MSETEALLVLPHLRIQNANAVSGPHTWGFPSMTAFVGLMHALERKLSEHSIDLKLYGVGVVCHHHEAQTSRDGFANTFHLTRNPVDHKGNTAAIVEEGRIHLDVSLVFDVGGSACYGSDGDRVSMLETINDLIGRMRIAGGSVIPTSLDQSPKQRSQLVTLSDDPSEANRQFRIQMKRLLPAFTLVRRNNLLHDHWEDMRLSDPTVTLLDAWIDLSRLNMQAVKHESFDSNGNPREEVEWQVRTPPGWIVPISIGYGALTNTFEPGTVANARDMETPFRFVESLFSIGEWISPHRLRSPNELFWYPESDIQKGLYYLYNDYHPQRTNTQ